LVVEHLSKSDLIVNTAQMRDAASLEAFRWIPAPLNTANIVKAAAEQAYFERQKQKKIAADVAGGAAANEDSHEISDSEPARKRTKGTEESSNEELPSGSRTRPSERHSSSLRHVFPALQVNAGSQQSFIFANTFQSNFKS
jgi:hypothetical protein